MPVKLAGNGVACYRISLDGKSQGGDEGEGRKGHEGGDETEAEKTGGLGLGENGPRKNGPRKGRESGGSPGERELSAQVRELRGFLRGDAMTRDELVRLIATKEVELQDLKMQLLRLGNEEAAQAIERVRAQKESKKK